MYQKRLQAYIPVEESFLRGEKAVLEWCERQKGRTTPLLVLLDSRGKARSSEELASWLGAQRDAGQQSVILAIGPPDGWSKEAREKAAILLSFGPMTLPHELVRVVLAEQLYRAFTILAGHPYHIGH